MYCPTLPPLFTTSKHPVFPTSHGRYAPGEFPPARFPARSEYQGRPIDRCELWGAKRKFGIAAAAFSEERFGAFRAKRIPSGTLPVAAHRGVVPEGVPAAAGCTALTAEQTPRTAAPGHPHTWTASHRTRMSVGAGGKVHREGGWW